MYHILTHGTDPTLTWSGVNFKRPGRLINDPIELYACRSQKIPFYYIIPSKHAYEQCLNADFLTGVQGVWKKYMFEVEISSSNILFLSI